MLAMVIMLRAALLPTGQQEWYPASYSDLNTFDVKYGKAGVLLQAHRVRFCV